MRASTTFWQDSNRQEDTKTQYVPHSTDRQRPTVDQRGLTASLEGGSPDTRRTSGSPVRCGEGLAMQVAFFFVRPKLLQGLFMFSVFLSCFHERKVSWACSCCFSCMGLVITLFSRLGFFWQGCVCAQVMEYRLSFFGDPASQWQLRFVSFGCFRSWQFGGRAGVKLRPYAGNTHILRVLSSWTLY